MVNLMNCPHCHQPLIEIDRYGERWIGCLNCNKWAKRRDPYPLGSLPMANWNGNGPYSAALRSIAAQEMLLHTARMRLAKKGMAAGKRNAPLPRVQRPGAASAPIGAASANVVNAKKNLDRTGSVRDAAKLVAAQRRAAKRGGNPYA